MFGNAANSDNRPDKCDGRKKQIEQIFQHRYSFEQEDGFGFDKRLRLPDHESNMGLKKSGIDFLT